MFTSRKSPYQKGFTLEDKTSLFGGDGGRGVELDAYLFLKINLLPGEEISTYFNSKAMLK